jgi:hypothetical protein
MFAGIGKCIRIGSHVTTHHMGRVKSIALILIGHKQPYSELDSDWLKTPLRLRDLLQCISNTLRRYVTFSELCGLSTSHSQSCMRLYGRVTMTTVVTRANVPISPMYSVRSRGGGSDVTVMYSAPEPATPLLLRHTCTSLERGVIILITCFICLNSDEFNQLMRSTSSIHRMRALNRRRCSYDTATYSACIYLMMAARQP